MPYNERDVVYVAVSVVITGTTTMIGGREMKTIKMDRSLVLMNPLQVLL